MIDVFPLSLAHTRVIGGARAVPDHVCHPTQAGNAAGQVGAAVDHRTYRGLVGSDLEPAGPPSLGLPNPPESLC